MIESHFLNKDESDQAVVADLLQSIKQLQEPDMDEIVFFQDKDGKVMQVINFEAVNRDEIAKELAEAETAVAKLKDALAKYDELVNSPSFPITPDPNDLATHPNQPVQQPVSEVPAGQTEVAPVDPNAVPAPIQPEQVPVDQAPAPLVLQ